MSHYKFLGLLLTLITLESTFGMTRVQLKKTMTVMKNQCMPKHGVNEDKVGKIEEGVFLEDHNVMCYVACIYQMVQVVKNNRLDRDSVFKQVDILYPPEIRAAAKEAINKCIDVQDKYSDMCEGIFNSVKCLHKEDPASFIFP